MIATTERALYDRVWQDLDRYQDYSPGEQYVGLFQSITSSVGADETVLDAGCGSGKGAMALHHAGVDVTMCDVTAEGLLPEARVLPFVARVLWADLRGPHGRCYDYVYCCDVLEHIPTEYTMLVLHRLLEASTRGVFLSIALVPDAFGVWVGEPLHKTVQSFEWWRDRIASLAEMVDCRDFGVTGIYVARRRG